MFKECREACGGQGIKSENRVGPLKSEFDVQSTFEGDNNVLMQQVWSLHHFIYLLRPAGFRRLDSFIVGEQGIAV